jgi:hypothetical protein
LFHFLKCLPHPDQAGAATCWIDYHIGQLPVQLFS